ncbi:MAG TPA: nitroreductase family deazaflavin-dependent oxidoreductase [Ilumatobacter sp.]|nr:nitroreductase family deazaflavin-dependent oxidoreductase [Ilumatobacter sp.]
MSFTGEYVPSALEWVREQVAEYEASGGTQANTLRDTGIPVIVVTMQGLSGVVRKIALMRVEHAGEYALIASMGGAPTNPKWYANIVAHPTVLIQDGPAPAEYTVREVIGAERDEWFQRGIDVFPNYAEYQAKTDRVIPVLVATPAA